MLFAGSMRIVALGLVGVALGVFLSLAAARVLADEPAPLVVEVEPRAPLTSRVLFVVDVSGSVRNAGLLGHALGQVRAILEQPVDALQVGVIAFAGLQARWPGQPAPGVPDGWAELPDAEAAEAALDWIEAVQVGSATNVVPALQEALQEPRDGLSVVLVSDGEFPDVAAVPQRTAVLQAVQGWRDREGYGAATLMVYGVGPRQTSLANLAELGGGGYFRHELPMRPPHVKWGPW